MRTAQSSHLQSYEYDQESGTLTVHFQDGSVYQYPGVPPGDYLKLVQSGGGGTAFWSLIRRQRPGVKVVTAGRETKANDPLSRVRR